MARTKRRARSTWNIGNTVGAAARLGLKAYRSYNRTQTRRRPAGQRSGQGVTSQHDSKLIYRKKRMPAKRRKRWTNFIKKVEAVEDTHKAQRSVVFNDQVTLDNGNGINQPQQYQFCPLYSAKSTTAYGGQYANGLFSDLNRIVSTEFATQRNVRHIRFTAAILDITIAGQTDPDVIYPPTEVDLYYCQFRKDVYHADFVNLVNESQGLLPTLPVSIPGAPPVPQQQVDLIQAGVTPFEIPTLCSTMKIMKKEKIITNTGGITTRQWRIPANKNLYSRDFRHLNQSSPIAFDQDMFAMKGWTCGILIIAKGTPSSGTAARPLKLEVAITRSYHYKIYEYSADASAYRPSINAPMTAAG